MNEQSNVQNLSNQVSFYSTKHIKSSNRKNPLNFSVTSHVSFKKLCETAFIFCSHYSRAYDFDLIQYLFNYYRIQSVVQSTCLNFFEAFRFCYCTSVEDDLNKRFASIVETKIIDCKQKVM